MSLFALLACLRRPLRICSSSLPPPRRLLDRAICPKGPRATERGWSREGRKGEAGTKCELMDGRTTASIPSAQHTTCVQCSAVRGVHGISTPSHSSQLQSDLLTVSLTTYTTSSVRASFHSRRKAEKPTGLCGILLGSIHWCCHESPRVFQEEQGISPPSSGTGDIFAPPRRERKRGKASSSPPCLLRVCVSPPPSFAASLLHRLVGSKTSTHRKLLQKYLSSPIFEHLLLSVSTGPMILVSKI